MIGHHANAFLKSIMPFQDHDVGMSQHHMSLYHDLKLHLGLPIPGLLESLQAFVCHGPCGQEHDFHG